MYRSHYRVCTAPPPRIHLPTPKDISELLYSPVSLKHAAALVLIKNTPPKFNKAALTPDLRQLLDEALRRNIRSRSHMEVKDRTCPTACQVRVGGFADAPSECLNRPCPEMFTMDLLKSAASVLRGLEAADKQTALDQFHVVQIVVNSRYIQFAKLQELTTDILMPPIDVAAVWFSHMLQSKEFATYWRGMSCSNFANMPHIWTRALGAQELAAAEARGRKAWGTNKDPAHPCHTYDFQGTQTPALQFPVLHSPLGPNVVIRDRSWLRELLRSTGATVDQILGGGSPAPGYTSRLHSAHALTRRVVSEPPYENGWSCDNCKVLGPKGKPVWHCDPCSFDLCDACIAHPAHRLARGAPIPRPANKKTVAQHAHELTWAVQKAELYKHGWSCDGCKKTGTGEVWHCDACMFDLCDACVPKVPLGRWNCSICNHEGSGQADCCNTCNFVMCNACNLNGPLLRDTAPCSVASTAENRSTYMQQGLVGYQRYLYLLGKWALTMETRSFAPPPIIDLFWHTHLSHPVVYCADSVRLLGSVRHHKLLDSPYESTLLMEYKYHNFEERIWKAEFNESMAIYSHLGALKNAGSRGGKREENNFALLKPSLMEPGPWNSLPTPPILSSSFLPPM